VAQKESLCQHNTCVLTEEERTRINSLSSVQMIKIIDTTHLENRESFPKIEDA